MPCTGSICRVLQCKWSWYEMEITGLGSLKAFSYFSPIPFEKGMGGWICSSCYFQSNALLVNMCWRKQCSGNSIWVNDAQSIKGETRTLGPFSNSQFDVKYTEPTGWIRNEMFSTGTSYWHWYFLVVLAAKCVTKILFYNSIQRHVLLERQEC